MCDSTFSIAPSRDARPAPQKSKKCPALPVKVVKSCGAEQNLFESIEIQKAILTGKKVVPINICLIQVGFRR